MQWLLSGKMLVLYVFIACGVYVHFRGQERHKFSRQLLDHSTLMGPYNCFVYATSQVKNRPFLPMEHFPELALLRDNWRVFREEAMNLFDEGYIRQAASDNDLAFHSFFRTGWKRFYLKWYDEPQASAKALCPRSVALVDQLPGVNAAMFALLPAGARLGKHRDPFAGSLRYHLGLVTPNDDRCAIYVDGEQYAWRDGQDVMFDETFIHWAENRTDQDRLILFCDVERPLRFRVATAINRVFKKVVVRATSTENVEGDHVGALNRVFDVIYKARAKAKDLKKRDRRLYYLLKWLLIGGLFWAIFIR
ncbi:aspartyl/asparaginyl beta-hydroxylase domain-containing protein [Alloalcanivorax mobilis]|uniref:aspartyl/asparaginyl beta-hydroxylase domain-containing protein n=1 Tax=Alloalcanivorax mobilis TaxID=2019569 RepID=UPI000C78E7B9|nr:aspartyl/asparaginyl beta-hydroxylase domain-containing protein [Alloalcanivorax mobilis]